MATELFNDVDYSLEPVMFSGLEPCPFCGSERLRKTEWLIAADQGERDVDVIECLDCDAAAPIEVWNRRAQACVKQ